MEPRVAWWSTLVSVNATVLAIAATFREKFELSQVWTSVALGLLSVSLLLALVMLYAWTHKPATERLAGLMVGGFAVVLFGIGFSILVGIGLVALW
jgi:uncharacterized membrane protein